MKTIYKPNDTIVEDLDEVIKILEKTNRHILTGSIRQLRDELYTLWNEQQKDLGWDKVEPTGLVQEPDVCPNDFRAEVAKDVLCAIVEGEGSCAHIKDKSLEQQVHDAILYADELIKQLAE